MGLTALSPLLPDTAYAGSSASGGYTGSGHRGLFRPLAGAKRQPQRLSRWRPVTTGAKARYTRSRESLVNEVAWPRGAISPRLVRPLAGHDRQHNFRPNVRREPPAKAHVDRPARAQRRAAQGSVFRPAATARRPSYEQMVSNRYQQLATPARQQSGYSAMPVYTPYWMGR